MNLGERGGNREAWEEGRYGRLGSGSVAYKKDKKWRGGKNAIGILASILLNQ